MNTIIYRLVQNDVVLDLKDNLNYYQERRTQKTLEYKGTIAISITENGSFLRGYLKKSTAKMIMEEIISDRFKTNFPNGYAFYGGNRNDGKITARVVNFGVYDFEQRGESYYYISIVEGEGYISERNGYVLKSDVSNKTVKIFLGIAEAKEMAIEIRDYIRTAELKGSLQGQPLFTTLIEE